ncbi:hypothetical protein SAMN05216386_0847 [Nitrosospira briensis]|uniref:Uncharacterized protein n=1 Tax=Nitrosospira briensis TaxID=35799 RepID=A0A1I4YR92_9PROT|nr:hypothetical protein [Nitrosospira briensis]SFN40568.1 hypothetical protein SAMN05216386_0847 [Nitrosospira briensis]
MMKKGRFLGISYVLGMMGTLLTVWFSSIEAAEYAGADAGIHSAVTLSNHEAMARFHEDAAMEMEVKVQEQKRLLEQYQAKSYLYGRQAQDLQGHTHALTRTYDKAAKAHTREAALHRERSIKLAEETFCNFPEKTGRC